MGSGLRLIEPTLSPSCKLYEQEAGLEAYGLEASPERAIMNRNF
jgi:hypothetical protein